MKSEIEMRATMEVIKCQLSIKELGLGERVLLNGWITCLEWVMK